MGPPDSLPGLDSEVCDSESRSKEEDEAERARRGLPEAGCVGQAAASDEERATNTAMILPQLESTSVCIDPKHPAVEQMQANSTYADFPNTTADPEAEAPQTINLRKPPEEEQDGATRIDSSPFITRITRVALHHPSSH